MMGAGGAHYDLARFGMEVFRASPRQADVMIVAGRVSQKMAPVLRTIYDQMMEPKWVISMGVCASSGGMFNNYAIVQGVDQVVPVDVYAPGCPPGPETLMQAIITLHGKIETGEILRRRDETGSGAQIFVDQVDGQTAGGFTLDRNQSGFVTASVAASAPVADSDPLAASDPQPGSEAHFDTAAHFDTDEPSAATPPAASPPRGTPGSFDIGAQ